MDVEEPDMTAKQIYDELIKRCKQNIKSVTSSVFDPETGIIKTFVQGKLVSIQQIRSDK